MASPPNLGWSVGSIFRRLGSVLRKIASHVLSYGVAGACGAVASMVVMIWSEAQKTESYQIGTDSGIAYPGTMFDNAERDGYRIVFKPADFQRVAVCEWSVARGQSWWEFSQNYLAKYPECFVVRRMSEKSIEVYPGKIGDDWSKLQYNPLTKTYWCKCPPEISGVK